MAVSLTAHFHEDSRQWHQVPLNEAPGTTFLKSIVDICDSVEHCSNNLPQSRQSALARRRALSVRTFSASAFALMMSHFEAYQRSLFAELINTLDFMTCLDDLDLARKLEKEGCALSVGRILAGRGDPREPGQIIADALGSWHNPDRVNAYFRTVFPKMNLYSNESIVELSLMWQVRHSIVHTAGIITREDSLKIAELRAFRERKLVLEAPFVSAVGRRFHSIIKESSARLEEQIRPVLIPAEDPIDTEGTMRSITGCESPRRSWFKSRATGA